MTRKSLIWKPPCHLSNLWESKLLVMVAEKGFNNPFAYFALPAHIRSAVMCWPGATIIEGGRAWKSVAQKMSFSLWTPYGTFCNGPQELVWRWASQAFTSLLKSCSSSCLLQDLNGRCEKEEWAPLPSDSQEYIMILPLHQLPSSNLSRQNTSSQEPQVANKGSKRHSSRSKKNSHKTAIRLVHCKPHQVHCNQCGRYVRLG